MKIHKKPSDITVTFSPDDYWLKRSDDEFNGEYMLVARIDRSEKGKDDDEGAPVLYMSEQDADLFREAGFGEIMI